jgi:hypothetical protein
MNRSIFFRFVLALVLLGAIVGLGIFAYQAGVTHGMAVNVQGLQGETSPLPYPPMLYGFPFAWGGYGILSCLVPLFLLSLAFFAVRHLFWPRPFGWRAMRRGMWGMGPNAANCEPGRSVPPFFEEWHRRMHGEAPSEPVEKQS